MAQDRVRVAHVASRECMGQGESGARRYTVQGGAREKRRARCRGE